MKQCAYCGTEFEPKMKSQIFCSPQCIKESQREEAKWNDAKYYIKQCPICQNTFIADVHTTKYCCNECRRKAIRNRQKEYEKNRGDNFGVIECWYCGKEFKPKTITETFCCSKCQANYKKYVKRIPPKTEPKAEPKIQPCKRITTCRYGSRCEGGTPHCDYLYITGHSRVIEDMENGLSGEPKDCLHYEERK